MTRQVAAVRLNWANIGDLLSADFSVLNAAHAVQSSGAVRLPWLTDAGGELCYYSFYCTENNGLRVRRIERQLHISAPGQW